MSQSNKFATIFRILTLNFCFCASSIIAKASLLLAGEVDLLIVEFCMILHLYDLIFTMGKYKREDRRQWAQWWKGAELHKAYNETQTIRS